MSCADVRQQLSSYVDGILAPQERGALDAHLHGCQACQRELDALRHMVHALHTLEQPAVPDLVAGVRAKLSREPWWRTMAARFTAPWPVSLPLHGAALAAAAVLILVVANRSGAPVSGRLAKEKAPMRLASATAPEAPASRAAAPMLQQGLEADQALSSSRAEDMVAYGGRLDDERRNAAPLEEAESRERQSLDALEKSAMIGQLASAIGEQNELKAATIQVVWRIQDPVESTEQLMRWVPAHHASVVAVEPHRFLVTLAAKDLPDFLQQFSSDPVKPAIPQDQAAITVSLQLAPAQ